MSDLPDFGPRGLRNNNPGNVRAAKGMKWMHQTGEDEAGFCTFDDPVWGIRVIAMIWQNYQYYHGFTCLRQYVSRWAPPSENKTDAYLAYMATELGVDSDGPFDPCNKPVKGLTALITFENGTCPYSKDTLNRALTLAHLR
jgi:hypothetical protein